MLVASAETALAIAISSTAARSRRSRRSAKLGCFALSVATAVIYVVSLRGNYLYGHSLGQTPEKRELFAWANVAADIWSFELVAVLLLWRSHKRMSLVALVA